MKETEYQRAEHWLRRAVRNAPKPLPSGRFPQLLEQAVRAGFSRSVVNDVVDAWLQYGYCRVTDQITDDIALTPAGMTYFGGVSDA